MSFDIVDISNKAAQAAAEHGIPGNLDRRRAFTMPRVEILAATITQLELQNSPVTLENFVRIANLALATMLGLDDTTPEQRRNMTNCRRDFQRSIADIRAEYREQYGYDDDSTLLTGPQSTFSDEIKQLYQQGQLTYGKVLERDPGSFFRSLGLF